MDGARFACSLYLSILNSYLIPREYTKVDDQRKIATEQLATTTQCCMRSLLMNSNAGEVNDLSDTLLQQCQEESRADLGLQTFVSSESCILISRYAEILSWS
jgi:hypothetical protein